MVETIENISASKLFGVFKETKLKLIAENKIMDKKDKHIYPIKETAFQIPNNWMWCYLSDLSIIQEGPGIRKHQYQTEGVQFLTVTNILEGSVDLKKSEKYISLKEYNEKYKHFTINKGDIVTACSGGSWGKSSFYDFDNQIILNTSTLRLRFFNDLSDNRYLYFLTKTSYFKGNLSSHSTGQQANYGYSHYSKIPIPLPPLKEQKQIVAILDKAFTAIDKAKTNAQQNLINAKELFESYLQNVFEDKGDDWLEKKWGELCHFVRGPFGGSLKKSIFKESGYVVYEQKHAIHDHFNQLRYFIDEEKFNEMKRFEVKPGDIIMSCSGVTLGRVAIIPESIPQGIINQALLKLTPHKEVNVEFLKHWLRSNIFQNIIFEHSGGAAIPNVPAAKILKEIIIPLPSINQQLKLVAEIELMLTQTKKLEVIYQQKIADLEELKKSVLQKAFNGELTQKELV